MEEGRTAKITEGAEALGPALVAADFEESRQKLSEAVAAMAINTMAELLA